MVENMTGVNINFKSSWPKFFITFITFQHYRNKN